MKNVVVEGVVEHGRQLGRELGFPTANLSLSEPVDAEDGVYSSDAEVDGVHYRAMSNLGYSPSVGGGVRRLETHLFDFVGELYGCTLRVELRQKIRDERNFDSLDALRAQITKDKEIISNLK